MAVPADARGEGRLSVNTQARALAAYTLTITRSEKWFPEDQKDYVQKIRDAALEIYILCWRANNINVGKSWRRYERRLALEADAADLCNGLQAMIELAKPLFHLRSRRARYWVKMVTDLRGQIRNWYQGDMERLRPGSEAGTPGSASPEANPAGACATKA